jgi:hypothetical protein
MDLSLSQDCFDSAHCVLLFALSRLFESFVRSNFF